MERGKGGNWGPEGCHRIGIRIGPRQLHAVRDSCLVIKVKFVNLQFSSKGRLLVDWTRLFQLLCSASSHRVRPEFSPGDCDGDFVDDFDPRHQLLIQPIAVHSKKLGITGQVSIGVPKGAPLLKLYYIYILCI